MTEQFWILKGDNIMEQKLPDYKAPVITSADCITVAPAGPSTCPETGNPYLLTAASYVVLAKTTITNSGSSVLNGNLGLYPGTSVTGFPPGTLSGTENVNNAAALQAYNDVTAAVATLLAITPVTDITSVDLGGTTYTPGHYNATTQTAWTAGPLTLNGAGVYVFSFGSTFITPNAVSFILTNGATADKVYFIAGSAITFGANNTLYGNFLAGTAITTASNTIVSGRLLVYGPSGTFIQIPSAAVAMTPASAVGPVVPPVPSGAFSYQITALNGPTAFYATYLPYTLSLNKSTGLITGTIYANSVGEFRIPLQAVNDAGVGTKILTIFA